jgi:hypothetical protein
MSTFPQQMADKRPTQGQLPDWQPVVSSDLPWERCWQYAATGLDDSSWLRAHAVAPCLLHSAGPEHPVSDAIKSEAASAKALHLVQQQLLKQLPEAFADLPYLLFKGAALGALAYPQAWLRTGGDIDVVVAPDRIAEARDRLEALGFRPSLSAGGDLVFTGQEMVLVRGGLKLVLDLHWAISSRPALAQLLPFETLVAHAVQTELGKTFHPAHALLHTVMHRYGHHAREAERLIWLLDVHLLWRGFDDQGQQSVSKLAIELGIASLLQASIQSAGKALGTELDGDLANLLDRAGRDEPCRQLVDRPRPSFWFDLKSLPAEKRMRYIRQLLFPPESYMRQRFNAPRTPVILLYLKRLGRGLLKVIR